MTEVNECYESRPFGNPIWQKYTMTIEEAAAYFHIGRTRMRALVAENHMHRMY